MLFNSHHSLSIPYFTLHYIKTPLTKPLEPCRGARRIGSRCADCHNGGDDDQKVGGALIDDKRACGKGTRPAHVLGPDRF